MVSALQTGAEAARSGVAQLRAEHSGLDRAIADDSARMLAARNEMRDWTSRSGEAARRIEEMTKRARAVEAEAHSLADAPAHLDARIAALTEALDQLSFFHAVPHRVPQRRKDNRQEQCQRRAVQKRA